MYRNYVQKIYIYDHRYMLYGQLNAEQTNMFQVTSGGQFTRKFKVSAKEIARTAKKKAGGEL